MVNFIDKIILITGAAGGTGRRLAEALAGRGAVIAAVDINPLGLDETVANIRSAGGRVKEYIFDAAKRLPVVALVDAVLDDWGRIDILVLAAEVRPLDPILTMDEWDFYRTLDVNLAGPFFLMQRVAQAMKNQGGGTIVIASRGETGGEDRHAGLPQQDEAGGEGRHAGLPQQGEAGLPPRKDAGLPQRDKTGEGAAYRASKAALGALTQAAHTEFGAYNIQVKEIVDCRF